MAGADFRRTLLAPLGELWAAGARIKSAAYAAGVRASKRLPGVVVSVGNLTVGGTGKTPMVILLAERLAREGKHVGILTRGYRGASDNGVAQSDEAAILRARLEPKTPVAVGPDRLANGESLAREGVEWLVLDDGFQHMQLARNADIVMVDAMDPFGGGRCLPAGRLREPVSALRRADIVVITRADRAPAIESLVRRHTDAPVFYANTKLLGVVRIGQAGQLTSVPAEQISTKSVFAFCGIGNPAAFFADLRRWRFRICGTQGFRDHHHYTGEDANALEEECRAAGAEALICTEKDVFNLREANFSNIEIFAARIALEIADAESFFSALHEVIERNRSGVRI